MASQSTSRICKNQGRKESVTYIQSHRNSRTWHIIQPTRVLTVANLLKEHSRRSPLKCSFLTQKVEKKQNPAFSVLDPEHLCRHWRGPFCCKSRLRCSGRNLPLPPFISWDLVFVRLRIVLVSASIGER